jgi:hypothetical protein
MSGLGVLATRRVIQIAAAAAEIQGEIDLTVVALCDDSTMWSNEIDARGHFVGWVRLEPVPGTVAEEVE